MSNVEEAYQKVYNTEGSQGELTAYAMKKLVYEDTSKKSNLGPNKNTLEYASLGRYGPIVIHGFPFESNPEPSLKGVQGYE